MARRNKDLPAPNKDLAAPLWADALPWVDKYSQCLFGQLKPPLDCFNKFEVWELAQEDFACIPRTVALCRLLIEALGKEEAGKRIAKTVFDEYFEYGRRAAEMMGYPKDLDSFCKALVSKAPPAVPVPVFTYRTPRKVIYKTGNRPCTPASLFKKYADREMQAFIGEYLDQQHDFGWVKGFNPNIKTTHAKHFMRGDDCCEYVFELPEK